MLKTNQLIQLFSKNNRNENISQQPDIYSMVNIMSYVNVETGIESNGIDYFSKINILELSKSEMPDETLHNMIEDGWFVTKDKKFIKKIY